MWAVVFHIHVAPNERGILGSAAAGHQLGRRKTSDVRVNIGITAGKRIPAIASVVKYMETV